MSTAKEIKEMLREARQRGLDVDTESRHHKVRAAADSPVLGVIPKTPGSQRSVLKSKIITERILRGEPARPESDNHGPNSPGKVVSEQAQTPAADEATEQASTVRRADRRAQQEAEEAADAAAAERIKNKSQRKAKAEPAPEPKRREYVRPVRGKADKLGCVRMTSPTGQPAMYNSDVARKNGKEVRPEDIHLEETVIFWPEARETGKVPSCFSCYEPDATGVLFFGPVRLIDRRDLYLALGRPLKQAVAMATKDHREGRLTKREDGEYVGRASLPLCDRCHGRYAASGLRKVDDDWVAISDWKAFLADRVWVNKHGGIEVRKPADPGAQ